MWCENVDIKIMCGKNRFTLIELLVVVAIIGILASILMPSLSKAREKATSAVCLSTQRQISIAAIGYQTDYDRMIPLALGQASPPGALYSSGYATWWPDVLNFEDKQEFSCPSVPTAGIGIGHADIGVWLGYGIMESKVKDPVRTVMFADAAKIVNLSEPDPNKWQADGPNSAQLFFRTPTNEPFYSDISQAQRVIGRHSGKLNSLFVDGHGETVKPAYLGFQYSEYDAKALWDLH